MEVPRDDPALRRTRWLCIVSLRLLGLCTSTQRVACSTKLDAEKRLALQDEKQALETRLLEVYVFYVLD